MVRSEITIERGRLKISEKAKKINEALFRVRFKVMGFPGRKENVTIIRDIYDATTSSE